VHLLTPHSRLGEQHGIGYIFDIVKPETSLQAKHYYLPRSNTVTMMAEDIAYLRSKGVFSLPSDVVCQDLLHAYFYHVHPIIPVVDAGAILGPYNEGGPTRINLLLLWSMFSVASNVSTLL
jgi:hypothetical protein